MKITGMNNKTYNTMKKSHLFALGLGTLLLASCSSQDEIADGLLKPSDPTQPYTCRMLLTADKPAFDDEATARSAAAWEDGDKIHLTFTVGTETTYGDAVYANEDWTVNYYGQLADGATGDVKAVYFENATTADDHNVILNKNTAVYEDLAGKYSFSDNTLSVTAALTPKTGRMRFAGEDDETIKVHGIATYSSYDSATGSYTKTQSAVTETVTDGYTLYVYGEFENATAPRLIIITSDWAYTRDFATTIFKTGESGYITIPTLDSRNGWYNGALFKFGDVELKMLPIKTKTDFFLMAETETTEDLYCALNGGKPTKGMPKVGIDRSNWINLVSNLKTITNVGFKVPTVAEWKTAAGGPTAELTYTYSGSNTLSEVGWYADNSGGTLHKVKLLAPNAFGMYDMSGNAEEYCYYTDSSSSSYYCGGYYDSSKASCEISYSSSYFYSSYCTLRLCIRETFN